MGILIAGIITTIIAMIVIGLLIRKLANSAPRWVLVLAFLSALPAQPVAFYLVRMPLHDFLMQWIGTGILLTAISLFYAPLIEEPAKWFSLVLPSLRRKLTPDNAVAIALAVGLGFGVGEIWFIAERLTHVPQLSGLPFYYFNGFLTERLMVCFLHGAMIALVFKRFAEGRAVWPSALLGIALHFALNFPIYLQQINLFGLGPQIWGLILVLYVAFFTLGMFLFVNRLANGSIEASMLSSAICPGCGKDYPRSLLALNLLTKRYERCPHCRKFHLVPMRQPARDKGEKA